MGPGSIQKVILKHFQAQGAEWAQEATRARSNRKKCIHSAFQALGVEQREHDLTVKNAYILLSKLWALSNASTI